MQLGSKILAGCNDGSLRLWLSKAGTKAHAKEDGVFKAPVQCSGSITALAACKDGATLATRFEGGALALWDTTKLVAVVYCVIPDALNQYAYANMTISPDAQLLCVGTSSTATCKAQLLFFPLKRDAAAGKEITISSTANAFMKIGVAANASVISVHWQANTHHIFCGYSTTPCYLTSSKVCLCSMSTGAVRVFFDPRFSVKGAMISAAKAPKREKDPTDFAVLGEILAPNALKLFRTEESNSGKRKYQERKDPIKSKAPAKSATSAPGSETNNSFFFTQYVMQSRTIDNTRAEDPREALLKFDDKARSDPMFLGPAYEGTQPKTEFHALTFEQEQAEFKKRLKKN